MARTQKIDGSIKHGTRDRNPRRKYEYDSLRMLDGRRVTNGAQFQRSAKAMLFLLVMLPLLIGLAMLGLT